MKVEGKIVLTHHTTKPCHSVPVIGPFLALSADEARKSGKRKA